MSISHSLLNEMNEWSEFNFQWNFAWKKCLRPTRTLIRLWRVKWVWTIEKIFWRVRGSRKLKLIDSVFGTQLSWICHSIAGGLSSSGQIRCPQYVEQDGGEHGDEAGAEMGAERLLLVRRGRIPWPDENHSGERPFQRLRMTWQLLKCWFS